MCGSGGWTEVHDAGGVDLALSVFILELLLRTKEVYLIREETRAQRCGGVLSAV